MGCHSCKSVAVIPTNTVKTEIKLLNDVEPTEQRASIIQHTLPELIEPNKTEKFVDREPLSRSKRGVRRSQSTKQSVSNNSERATTGPTAVFRSMSTRTMTSNVHPKFIPETTWNDLNEQNLHDDIDVNATSNDVTEVVKRRSTVKSIVVESIISDTSEENALNETLSEIDGSCFRYDDVVSSSSSTDTEKTILRQNTFVRFTSAKPKTSNAHPETFPNDISSDLDESYPLHDSFVTSTSSDCEEISTQQETVVQPTLTHKQKSYSNENIITTDPSDESNTANLHFQAVTSSMSSNSEETGIHREVVIKFSSSNRTKSDIRQKPIVYETSSDSHQF
jgi:hypothetical protein